MEKSAAKSSLALRGAFGAVYDSLNKRDPEALALSLAALARQGFCLAQRTMAGRQCSPLYTLISRFGSAKPEQCRKCLLLLEQYGADLSEPPDPSAFDSRSPLSAACLKANLAACEFFLERGAVPDLAAFQCAIDYRRTEIFKAMIDSCAPETAAFLVPHIQSSLAKSSPLWRSQSLCHNSKNEEKSRKFVLFARAAADAALLRTCMPPPGEACGAGRAKPRI